MVTKKTSKKTEKKAKKVEKVSEKELEEELEEIEEKYESKGGDDKVSVKASKPIAQLKKGDKLKIDGKEFEVDAHYILIDHGTTKEMTIEIFDKNDKDYQLRYFDDQAENTLEFYELQEIMYFKKPMKKIEW